VEIQPSVYECLANTLARYRPAFSVCPLAIAEEKVVYINTSATYEAVATAGEGPVQVSTITWCEFIHRFSIKKIDLLKINIEGGERAFLEHATDLSMVDRVIISAHDFRANRGQGEHFRTREYVLKRLAGYGFRATSLGVGDWWEDWIYAYRP
jgi:FkbM family methyltransferase